jgi:hypothetical protein
VADQAIFRAPVCSKIAHMIHLVFSQLSLFLHIFVALWTRTMTASSTPTRKEAYVMSPPRWLAMLTIPMMAGAALVGSAAIATANPDDDAYLAKLRAVGLTWPPKTEEALIGEAHLVCYDLEWDRTSQQIADEIHANLDNKGVTLLQVGSLVNAAHNTYCPGWQCAVPSLCE